jgi:hypothetical protein
MKLINFIIWLSVGAVIGWFASRLVEHRRTNKPMPVKVSSSEKS